MPVPGGPADPGPRERAFDGVSWKGPVLYSASPRDRDRRLDLRDLARGTGLANPTPQAGPVRVGSTVGNQVLVRVLARAR